MRSFVRWIWCGLLLTAALSSAPANAAVTISWNDFYRYGQSCGYECTRYAWVEVWYCDTQSGCHSQLEYQCVESAYICRSYRLTLSDGDIIDYEIASGTRSDGYEFILRSAQNVTWWKGLKGYRNGSSSSFAGEVSTQDGRHESSMLSFAPWDSNAYLMFAKAKMFGIHTDMYKLNIAQKMSLGQRCIFTWQRD